MSPRLLPVVATFCILSSCHQEPDRIVSVPPDVTPKALTEEKSFINTEFKRGGDDLVERLYSELAEGNPGLKSLEAMLGKLPEKREDSASEWRKYDSKSQSYYTAAGYHLAGIHDSVLKEKVKFLIELSQKKYADKTAHLNELLTNINTKSVQMEDLHNALKVALTLSVIAKYQDQQLPSEFPLQQVLKEYDNAIAKMDSLLKK